MNSHGKRVVEATETTSVRSLRMLFKALDTCPQNSDYTFKAARSGIEAALRTFLVS